MIGVLEIALSNTLVVLPLAILARILAAFRAPPALVHSLWLLALVKLLTPPLVRVPLTVLPSLTGTERGDSSSAEWPADPRVPAGDAGWVGESGGLSERSSGDEPRGERTRDDHLLSDHRPSESAADSTVLRELALSLGLTPQGMQRPGRGDPDVSRGSDSLDPANPADASEQPGPWTGLDPGPGLEMDRGAGEVTRHALDSTLGTFPPTVAPPPTASPAAPARLAGSARGATPLPSAPLPGAAGASARSGRDLPPAARPRPAHSLMAPLEASPRDLASSSPSPGRSPGGSARRAPRPSPWPGALLLVDVLLVVGGLSFLTVTVLRAVRFRRALADLRPAPLAWRTEARRLAGRLGLRRCPELCITDRRVTPLVWSFFCRPRVIVPAELLRRLMPDEVRTLLVHELAHVRRRDHWTRHLELVVRAAHWWNPVVWWIAREIRTSEEECCDAWVTTVLPRSRRAYTEALICTAEYLGGPGSVVPAAASGLGRFPELKRRLNMIVRGRTPRSLNLAGRVAVAGFALCIVPLLPVSAQEETVPPVAETREAAPIAEFVDALLADESARPVLDLLAAGGKPQDLLAAPAPAAPDDPFAAPALLSGASDPANPFAQQRGRTDGAAQALRESEQELARLQTQLDSNRAKVDVLHAALADLSEVARRRPDEVDLRQKMDELAVRLDELRASAAAHESRVASHRELVAQLARNAQSSDRRRAAADPEMNAFLGRRTADPAQAGNFTAVADFFARRASAEEVEQALRKAIARLHESEDYQEAAILAVLLDQSRRAPTPALLPGAGSAPTPPLLPGAYPSSSDPTAIPPNPMPSPPRASAGRRGSPDLPAIGRGGAAGGGMGGGRRAPSIFDGESPAPAADAERMDRLEAQMQSMQDMMRELLNRMGDSAPTRGRSSGGGGGGR